MLETLDCLRIVSTVQALDEAMWPDGTVVLRLAPDEALAVGGRPHSLDDEHAIVEPDRGWMGQWVDAARALAFLQRAAEWAVPAERPAFAQGMVAHLPLKVWLEQERALFVVSHTVAGDFEARLSEVSAL